MKTATSLLFLLFAMLAAGTIQAQEKGIVRLDASLDKLIASDAKLEVVSDDYPKGDGPATEGPVWISDKKEKDGGHFVFTDTRHTQLSRWSPSTPVSQAYDLKKLLGEMEPKKSSSSGLAVDPQGRIVFCTAATRSVVRIEPDGKATVLAHLFNGKSLDNPNDVVIKSNGTIFFTDNSRDTTGQMPPMVYRIKDGQLTRVIEGLVSPNGITLSPDDKVLYVNDIRPKKVYRYDVAADDSISNSKLFIDMNGPKEEGSNDGMRTEEKGNLYDSGPGGVWIISPEGKHLGTILTPDRITNLSFGGADGKTLLMTAHTAVYSIRVKTGVGRRR